jgi:hypothetical protein
MAAVIISDIDSSYQVITVRGASQPGLPSTPHSAK